MVNLIKACVLSQEMMDAHFLWSKLALKCPVEKLDSEMDEE